jgi:hypothetical protein
MAADVVRHQFAELDQPPSVSPQSFEIAVVFTSVGTDVPFHS